MTFRILILAFISIVAWVPRSTDAQEYVQSTTTLPSGVTGGAIAYAPDGTLYVLSGGGASSILAIDVDGTQSTIDLASGTSLDSLGGAAFDVATGRLLVTDNEMFGDGEGNLLSIDLEGGQTEVLASGIDFIDDVAFRSTGEIFFSNAVGNSSGSIQMLGESGTVTIASGLDFAAGIAFDAENNLVFQDVNDGSADMTFDFTASVLRLAITDDANGLNFGTTEELASGLSAGFDLVADSEGDLFVTGTGGLFSLDRNSNGMFLGTATNLVSESFATEAAFLSGTVDFEPTSVVGIGGVAPQLTFVPEFNAATLTTLTVNSVPEPASGALFAAMAVCLSMRRRRI
jgi:DNA-binding beta-propeller fold protein YncE